jgi:glycosyltransferase involved in cell wall biosynthesis
MICHMFVGVSKYQTDLWQFTGDIPRAVIGDGVDMIQMDNIREQVRNPNKVIWSSNPDRGLPLAARIFQEIRKRWPTLELHVYGRSAVYGWTDDIESIYLPLPEHMENIVLHDPLPRIALFKELKTAWAWFYPTWWPETFCMAALEAQAAGCPVIASPYGALNETVKGGILSYNYLNAFSQLRNKRKWQKLSDAGVEWGRQNSWDLRAQDWEEALDESQPGE